MPRLTDRDFLRIHPALRSLWLHQLQAFAVLSPREQWLMHDFYRPSELLTDADLLRHRRTVTTERPSLPQQAGRALGKLHRIPNPLLASRTPGARRTNQTTEDHQLQLYVVVKPDLATDRLADVLAAYLHSRLDPGQTNPPRDTAA